MHNIIYHTTTTTTTTSMLVATKFRSRLMSVECKIAKCWLWMDGSLSHIPIAFYNVFNFQFSVFGLFRPSFRSVRRAGAGFLNSYSVSHHLRTIVSHILHPKIACAGIHCHWCLSYVHACINDLAHFVCRASERGGQVGQRGLRSD